MQKYFAELVGTLALTLVVLVVSSSQTPALTPFLAALTLGLFVYSVGGISGAHLNPAITLAAWTIRKIESKDALAYMAAQFVGAGLALSIARLILPATLVAQKAANSWPVGLGEALGAFFFAFGIASVIYGKTPKDASGAVVGGSLLISIFLASTLSLGILNPAVALGLGSLNLMYLLGPIVGAVAGMWAYRNLA